MNKYTILKITSFCAILTGCAHSDYEKHITPEKLLYPSNENIFPEKDLDSKTLEDIALRIGEDRSGFIPPDRSPERIAFEHKFPIEKPKESDYGELDSTFHKIRMGQVILFSVDLDKRTQGFIKNKRGEPVALSGMFKVNQSEQIAMGAALGASSGIVTGAVNASLIDSQLSQSGLQLSNAGNTAVISSGIATGLIGGILAGAHISSMVESALNGIVQAKNFGERMEQSTYRHELPRAVPFSPTGSMYNVPPTKLAPGVIKRVLFSPGEQEIDYTQNIYFISVVGYFRGENYKNLYPKTLGWEYRISNIAKSNGHLNYKNYEEFYNQMKIIINKNSIKL